VGHAKHFFEIRTVIELRIDNERRRKCLRDRHPRATEEERHFPAIVINGKLVPFGAGIGPLQRADSNLLVVIIIIVVIVVVGLHYLLEPIRILLSARLFASVYQVGLSKSFGFITIIVW
jgi:hypothetical protein